MVGPFALGAALYFDTELFADSTPFADLVRALFRVASPDGAFTLWTHRVDNRRMPPPKPYKLSALLDKIATGEMRSAAAETRPGTADTEHMLVYAATGPAATLPVPFAPQSWRYDFEASLGAARVQAIGPQRVVDLVVAFADAVAAKAGVIHWAETARYASALASCSGNSSLTPEQSRKAADPLYWKSKWGQIVRGPAWGTFLSVAHIDALGGLPRIERESGCAQVVALASGGAFLQATAIDQPIVDDRDDGGRLAALTRFLTPVMGKAPTPRV